jgi:hypothetical protein
MPSIEEKFRSLDADTLMRLGAPTGASEEDVLDSDGAVVGRVRRFGNGVILWRRSTELAFAVYGAIYARYQIAGETRGALGWPLSDELEVPHGRVSHFEHADIYWNGGEGYIVFPSPPRDTRDPAAFGEWSVIGSSGVVGIHAALLRNGNVLFFAFKPPSDPNAAPTPQQYGVASVFNPRTLEVTTPSHEGRLPELDNVFCSGHAFLGDGRLLVFGGDREGNPEISQRWAPVRRMYVYDPVPSRFYDAGDMREPRWYPSGATLADGKVLLVGGDAAVDFGHSSNIVSETFDPATSRVTNNAVARLGSTYPIVFTLPDRRVLVHAVTDSQFIDVAAGATTGTVLPAAARPNRASRTYGDEGTAIMLPLRHDATPPHRASVMLIGGGGPGGINAPATASCEVLDVGVPAPAWRLTSPMHHPRVMPDAVLLPDGTVFVCNGSRTGHADAGAAPVFESEVYDPAADRWVEMAHMTVPRLYHATALLLPDGRVLVAGTDASWNPPPYNTSELRVEAWSPPYLFRGPRPRVSRTPLTMGYGQRFQIDSPSAARIDHIALVRAGSVTHSLNSDQRYLTLPIEARRRGQIEATSPPDGWLAPPGYYLLFALVGGVPSAGAFVRLDHGLSVHYPIRWPVEPFSALPYLIIYRPPQPPRHPVPGPDPEPRPIAPRTMDLLAQLRRSDAQCPLVVRLAGADPRADLARLAKLCGGDDAGRWLGVLIVKKARLKKLLEEASPWRNVLVLTDDPGGGWSRAIGKTGKTTTGEATAVLSAAGKLVRRYDGPMNVATLAKALKKEPPGDASLLLSGETSVLLHDPLGDVSVDLAAGGSLDLAKSKARRLTVCFWCSLAPESLDALERICKERAPKGTEVLAVNDGDDPTMAAKLVKERGIRATHAVDPERKLAARLGLVAWPTVIELDAARRVTAVRYP